MATSLLPTNYQSSPYKGKFSDIDFDFYGSPLGTTSNYAVAGLHQFLFSMDASPRNKHLSATRVTLQMRTIRGDAAFSKVLDLLDKKQGCYILHNSFTNETYVGKSEGTNSESPGLKARFKTHRTSPKLEFDMVFCVYLHDSVNDDLLKSCFTGQFLSFLEATLYSQVEARVKVGYVNPQDILINQPLTPITPALYVHLHSLISEYVAPSFLDWAVMTGLTLHPSISQISRMPGVSVSNSAGSVSQTASPNPVPVISPPLSPSVVPAAPAQAPVVVVPAAAPSPQGQSPVTGPSGGSNTFKLSNTFTKKSPFNAKTEVFLGNSATASFEEAISHVLNEICSGLGKSVMEQVCQQFSLGSCGSFIKYALATDPAPAWRGPRNISAKVPGLASGQALYVDTHSNTDTKQRRIDLLISHVSSVTGRAFTLNDFIC